MQRETSKRLKPQGSEYRCGSQGWSSAYEGGGVCNGTGPKGMQCSAETQSQPVAGGALWPRQSRFPSRFAWEWSNIGSRMTRECHVRFRERVGVRLPRATRQVCLMIRGQKHWLWRAVDQDGVVLDVLVQSRRDKKAAKRLLRKLLKKQCRAPRVMITDKLASYGAAKGEVMPSVEHR